jgi:hypothetical protein
MRNTVPERLEAGRDLALCPPEYGLTGAFQIMGPCGKDLRIIASDATIDAAQGWEHVSVSVPGRCPNWIEMCFVKDLFWGEDELVIQYHVPKSEHVDNHPFVLHLWRDTLHPHPRMPPSTAVGIKGLSQQDARKLASLWGRR